MSSFAWIILLGSQVALVVAQILLKQSMTLRELGAGRSQGWIGRLVLGIVTMTAWFLLWVGLMHVVDLSKLMPLEGISPLLIVFGAAVILKERLHGRAWAGIILTCAGVLLVSMS